MSRRSRPHYHSGLGWILGVAFEDTLTRPARLAQGFTHVRCCGSPRASSPHGLAAPALASRDGKDCVQLPPARGCYHIAPRRTFTSNPVPMPGTPSVGLRPLSGATAAAHSHPGCRIALPQEDSSRARGSILDAKGGRDWTRLDTQFFPADERSRWRRSIQPATSLAGQGGRRGESDTASTQAGGSRRWGTRSPSWIAARRIGSGSQPSVAFRSTTWIVRNCDVR